MSQTTIVKIDSATLPENEQKVMFHVTHPRQNEGWYNGVYISQDQIFFINGRDFYFASHVDRWKPKQ